MRALLLLVLLGAPLPLAAQPAGALSGRVLDARGAGLAGVSVFVPGTLAATFSDAGGAYRLDDVPPGAVTLRFALAGYRTATLEVAVAAGSNAAPDVLLRRLPFWERAALFSARPDAGGQPLALELAYTAETGPLPARRLEEAASLLPGLARDERGDSLAFLGGTGVARSLDGVPLPGPLALPYLALDRLTLYADHTPVRFAGGRDALLDVTTRDGRAGRAFSVEGLASPLSPAGLAEVRGTLGGSFLGDRVRFFAAGTVARQDDYGAAAVPFWDLKGSARARLAAQPQEIEAVRPGSPADRVFLPLPTGLPDTFTLADLAARVPVPDGYTLTPTLRSAAYGLTPADFERVRARRLARAETRSLLARFGLTAFQTDFDLTWVDAFDGRDLWDYGATLFRSDVNQRTDTRQQYLRADARRALGPLTLHATAAAYRDRATTYDPRTGEEVESLLDYGRLAHPANATARAYYTARPIYDGGEETWTFGRAYYDGFLPGPLGVADVFALPGTPIPLYEKRETDAYYLRLEATARRAGHELVAGAEWRQETRRAFGMADPRRLAYLSARETPPLAYGNLPYGYTTTYYGFDYLGLERVDDESFDAFVPWNPCGNTGDAACRAATRIAPFEASQWGFYAADALALGPFRLDVGLRYDLYGNNRLALAYPDALVPIVRAGSLDGVPAGIGDDFAVLFLGSREIAGYRSTGGQYFDVTGKRVEPFQGSPRPATEGGSRRLIAAAFRDAPTRGVFQPRAALRLAVAPQGALWLAFNRTAQAPDAAYRNATLADYVAAREGVARFIPDAALRPETATTFAAGGDATFGPARLGLRLAQHQTDDVPVLVKRRAFPNIYTTFAPEGGQRRRSATATATLDLARLFTLDAAYTLGGMQITVPVERWGAFSTDQYSSIEHTWTAHHATARLGYRAGAAEGPRVAGVPVLARLRALAALEAYTGGLYYPALNPVPYGSEMLQGAAGPPEVMPWHVLVHLQAERDVPVRGRLLTAFVQVRNLLDRANARRVYPATGLPDDDGYLNDARSLDDYPAGSIERFYYAARVADPLNYGLPREVRLGLRLAL